MKKLLALIIVALLGFYVAWPAWSGYRIATALSGADEATLASKIDFPAIRLSLRPAVTAEVEKSVQKQMGQGIGSLLSDDLKKQTVLKLVDIVLEKVVTPINVIRIAKEGGDVAGSVEKILMEELNRVGGIPGMPRLPGLSGGTAGAPAVPGGVGTLGGLGAGIPFGLPGVPNVAGSSQPGASTPAPAAPTPTKAADKPAAFGLANIKGFGFDGPLGLYVAVAKDPAALKPDVTATMRFTDFDWKLAALVPTL